MFIRTTNVGLNLTRNLLSSRHGLAILPATALRSAIHARGVQTQVVSKDASTDILNQQRLKRPNSPHFTIYQPQLTWVASIVNRATGTGLSVLLYGFSLSYIAGPVFGMPFDTAAIVNLVQALPSWFVLTGKGLIAASFAFHSFNGLRHLGWDMGRFLSLKGAYGSGYAVLGATAVATVALMLM